MLRLQSIWYLSGIWYLNELTTVEILKTTSSEFKKLLPVNHVPSYEQYRLGLLTTLQHVRDTKQYQSLNLTKIQAEEMLDSLCKS